MNHHIKAFLPKVVLMVFFANSPALSQTNREGLAALREEITTICQNPNAAGSYLKIEGEGKAEVSVGIPKLVGKAGVDGTAKFTKEEWAGVRKVLDQNAENNNYRVCAVELMKLLQDKFLKSSRSSDELFRKFTMSTPIKAIEESFGSPIFEREVDKSDLPKDLRKKNHVLQQYDTPDFDFFLITDKRRHLAYGILLKNQSASIYVPRLNFPIGGSYANYLKQIRFEAVADRCDGGAELDTNGPLLLSPMCALGADEGGGLNYTFGYDITSDNSKTSEQMEACIEGKKHFHEIRCARLQNQSPRLVFGYNGISDGLYDERYQLMCGIIAIAFKTRGIPC